MKKNIYITFLLIFIANTAQAMHWNMFRPWDPLTRPLNYPQKTFQYALFAEGSLGDAQGFSHDGEKNPLTLFNCSENAVAMLDGANPCSDIGQMRIALDANDNNTRGHFCVSGDLTMPLYTSFAAHWRFVPQAWIALYVPVARMKLTNVCWQELTQELNAADFRVKQLLTNNFFNTVRFLGNLNLTGWERTGFGDMVIMLETIKNFPQYRPLLQNVAIDGRIGLNFPTGKRVDPDELFSLPFGWDGAFGIYFAGGLQVMLGYNFRAGFDVELLHLFGNTRERRIKTAPDQTDLLFLTTVDAYKDFGLTQRFDLYVQAYRVFRGLSLLAGYKFLKHGEDKLSIKTCEFSNQIANSAGILQEWTAHQIIVNAQYECGIHREKDALWPQLSLFARIPIDGKRVVMFTTLGGSVSIDF